MTPVQIAVECHESIMSAHEIYAWLYQPPVKVVAYVKVTADRQGYGACELTTWTGETLGRGQLGRRYHTGGCARSTRRSIRIVGTNGKHYHGTYYESSGDYARLTQTT